MDFREMSSLRTWRTHDWYVDLPLLVDILFILEIEANHLIHIVMDIERSGLILGKRSSKWTIYEDILCRKSHLGLILIKTRSLRTRKHLLHRKVNSHNKNLTRLQYFLLIGVRGSRNWRK